MTNDGKPNPSTDFDVAASIAQPMALMTAGAMVGVALAAQTFGLWMQSTATMLNAMQRDGGDSDAREGKGRSSAASQYRSSTTPKPEVQAKEPFTARENVVPIRGAKATAKRAKAGPVRRDDLKAIAGIGPKLEQVLNGASIHIYAQLAALSADDIASLEARFGLEGRIARDDWQSQAVALAARYAADGSEIGRRGAPRRKELV